MLWFLAGQALAQVQQVVTLSPAADNSLFSEGELSNGGGQYLFTGLTAVGAERRALLRFDLGAIPAAARIDEVSLELQMSRTISGTLTVRLHRLQGAWGEGSGDAPAQEGTGIAAAPGDATWSSAASGSRLWASPGGDFHATDSARTGVRDVGRYTWQSAGMAADVQAWVNGSETNAGWILVGNAAAGFGSAKRFNSREHPDVASRPRLTVTFTAAAAAAPVGVPAGSAVGWILLAVLLVTSAAAVGPRGRA